MGQPLPLRPDYDAAALRALARRSKDTAQSRRLLALAAIYDGASRRKVTRLGSVTLQIVRNWILRFNAEGAGRPGRPQGAWPAAATDRCAPRRARRGDRGRAGAGDPRRGALAAGRPRWLALGGVPRIRLEADTEPGAARHGLTQALGPAAPSCAGRGRHRGVQENFPAALDAIAEEKGLAPQAIEVWFADGWTHCVQRVGQNNKITRRWAPCGSRPAAPQDQRTASTYIFGAVCRWQGKGAALASAGAVEEVARIVRQVRAR